MRKTGWVTSRRPRSETRSRAVDRVAGWGAMQGWCSGEIREMEVTFMIIQEDLADTERGGDV
ncbi:hypothetical protein E2C01_100758 [Portunus trituberculatus]|uniref:Uncharacterized protein n=1 Tax=Portunus trituberculatus TaxID=210409 RepID=A0A5B7KEF0_PORTR|nr:hypothetical protein [Portunus trituberculatus]